MILENQPKMKMPMIKSAISNSSESIWPSSLFSYI